MGETLQLHTSLIVREDALSLFGFDDRDELGVFGAAAQRDRRRAEVRARRARDAQGRPDRRGRHRRRRRAVPTRVGHRPKTAKLIVAAARGQGRTAVAQPHAALVERSPTTSSTQVAAALVGLGWSERVATEAVARRSTEATDAERDVTCRRCCDARWPRSARAQGGSRVADARDADEPSRRDRARDRGRAAADLASPSSSASRRCAASCSCCSTRPASSSARPTTSCLSGPPGLGKTTLAMIVAHESERPLRLSSGPAIQHAGDLAALLSSLTPGEVLFIDEIHRMARSAEEMLYLAMEDFRIDIMVGKGAGATSIPLDLAPFTLVGATTRSGLLPNPLRDRFGFTGHLEYYERVRARAGHRAVGARCSASTCRTDARAEIARRSRGTPRIANRLLRRVRDYVLVHGGGAATHRRPCDAALELYDVDSIGLDRLDRAVLDALVRRFRGGPVGLSTLAVAVGEEAETIESVVEPYLVRIGFLGRTPRGRVAMPEAYAHLGVAARGRGASDSMTYNR